MKKIIFLLIAIASVIYVDGQEVKPDFKPYYFWVLTDTTDKTIKGAFYALSDSSIILRNLKPVDDADSSYSIYFIEIHYSNIRSIKYRRKGSVGAGALIGLGGTTLIGTSVGLISGDDDPGFLAFSAEEKALLISVFFAPYGAFIGACVGAKRNSIQFDGNLKKFTSKQKHLKRLSLTE